MGKTLDQQLVTEVIVTLLTNLVDATWHLVPQGTDIWLF
jgi:hypothetical protein